MKMKFYFIFIYFFECKYLRHSSQKVRLGYEKYKLPQIGH